MQCLAAGSSILNREVESASMRPLAKTLTQHLDSLRSLLREQCLRNQNKFTDKVLSASHCAAAAAAFHLHNLGLVSVSISLKTAVWYRF